MDYLWKATGELLIKAAQVQPDRMAEGTLKPNILSELGYEFGFPQKFSPKSEKSACPNWN